MAPAAIGSAAPPVPGLRLDERPMTLFFYKVTCPVCQLAAPKVQGFEVGYPGHIAGIGQDVPAKLAPFRDEHGMTFRGLADEPPYDVSRAWGIQVVPTTILVDADGTVRDVVESWDRDGLNRLSSRMAELLGAEYTPISGPGDGLPVFRPG
jgi:peroxiredoxin